MTRPETDAPIATHALGGTGARVPVTALELLVVDGPDRGLRAPIGPGATRVGTAEGNQLRLGDPTVSRVHAELTPGRQGVRVRDTGSTNGTFVDGVRVLDAFVHPGALVRVGSTALRADARGDESFIELSAASHFGELLGTSAEMRAVYAVLERVARTDVTVLVQGETGTGKDLAARAIHAASPRAAGPLVTVDCGAIPENLIESELFGHARGAFTGAVTDRRGLFEEANGGTLFFDELGELPLATQRRLLRALERREIQRVGTSTPRPVDVRVIAATNRDLARAVNEGSFREDLYYRFAVVSVELPPLRTRRGDIPMLAAHFLERASGVRAAVPPALMASLLTRGWAGNVRELRNHLERAVSLGLAGGRASTPPSPPSPAGDSNALPPGLEGLVPTHLPLKEAREAWVERFESVYVRAVLKKTGGNVSRAAALAGTNRRFLYRLMARVGIAPTEGDPGEDD